MAKEHFISLADLIKARQWQDRDGAGLFIHDLADFLESEYPLFKRDRWLAYLAGECGPNGGPVKTNVS